MPNKQDTINIINNALQSDNKKVIVLKGDWGVGKTYLWKEIAEKNDKHSFFDICHKIHWLLSSEVRAKKEYKTGYVSLFGKKDFNEITQEAILSLYFKHKPRNIFEWLLIKTKSFWFKLFGVSNFQTITQSFSAVFALLGIYSLKNTIICFDDIERMDKNIDFKDFLGFVNDLAEHQKCKVVLIFNEKELFNIEKVENTTNENNDENDTEQIDASDNLFIYNKFKEKTIDLEVAYTPTFENNFNIACSIINHNLEEKYKNIINNLLNGLNENNIRIISKCIECVNDFINTVNNMRDKIKYYDDFSNTILLEIIKSITYITQQYWKAGHRFWDSRYIEKETSHLNDDKFIKAIKKYPNDYNSYIFQGKYLNALDTYFKGYSFNENILLTYLKNYEILTIYYNFEQKRNEYEHIFWGSIDGKFDDYLNNMCNLFEDEDNAYSFFINMSYPALQSYLHDSTLLKNSNIFKETFYKQINYSIDRYIEEYQNNFDIEYDDDMVKKIELINSTKTELLYKKPKDIKDYCDCLLYVTSNDKHQLCKYTLEQINYNQYKELCNTNENFYIYSKSLFFERNKYDIVSKIPHFLYIVATYLLETIEINPDNEIKYDAFGKIRIGKNDNNYSAKEDLNTYITQYQNDNQENE